MLHRWYIVLKLNSVDAYVKFTMYFLLRLNVFVINLVGYFYLFIYLACCLYRLSLREIGFAHVVNVAFVAQVISILTPNSSLRKQLFTVINARENVCWSLWVSYFMLWKQRWLVLTFHFSHCDSSCGMFKRKWSIWPSRLSNWRLVLQ